MLHRLLKERGGYWVTGDVYIKRYDPLARAAAGAV